MFPDASRGPSSQRADADALLTDSHLRPRFRRREVEKEREQRGGASRHASVPNSPQLATRLLYTFKLKPSISPAATYSPDPQTRSIKDGRPKPTVYGGPSYGARWDPEATPLRADRGPQPSASRTRPSGYNPGSPDHVLLQGVPLAGEGGTSSGSRPRPPPSTMIWV